MRAVISEDKDGKALLDTLELEKMRGSHMSPEISKAAFDVIHRKFHYEVVRWLQVQGFDLSR
jgi:hypothetical protein